MSDLEKLTKNIIAFRDSRDWKQFHNPKDLAISLTLEAGELLEHFQWKNADEVREYLTKNKQDVSDEVADVFNYLILIANELDIDLVKVTAEKLEKSAAKYPVEKSKGNHKKYTELQNDR